MTSILPCTARRRNTYHGQKYFTANEASLQTRLNPTLAYLLCKTSEISCLILLIFMRKEMVTALENATVARTVKSFLACNLDFLFQIFWHKFIVHDAVQNSKSKMWNYLYQLLSLLTCWQRSFQFLWCKCSDRRGCKTASVDNHG